VFRPENPHAEPVLSQLRSLAPEVLFVASYGLLLKRELLELAPHGALNAHASLLPRHRGASPIQAALLAGERETGVSIQRIVAALDRGDVLLSRAHAIGPRDTAGDLLQALAPIAGDAAVEALDRLERGEATFTPQDERLASYAPKLKKEDGRIDWQEPADAIERRVRAMSPWPTAVTMLPDGRDLQILRARLAEAPRGEPGTLVVGAQGGALVVAGRGALELEQVRLAGKRAVSGAEFLRGARLELPAPLGG
jgi:methionyl-tRNA formyltransferase